MSDATLFTNDGGEAPASPSKLLLVAVDASEQSLWAAQVAGGLAEALGGDVVLVHVMKTDVLGTTELAFTERELLAELRRKAEEVFAATRSRFPAGVKVQRLLREGNPGREIVASAAEWGANLVVMGAHARGRLATFVLGSTADAVIRGAHCPVVTVAHDPQGKLPLPAGGSVSLASVVV